VDGPDAAGRRFGFGSDRRVRDKSEVVTTDPFFFGTAASSVK
jgi:hypothetical protein